MCGIIGYIGYRETSSILIDGLKRLEYRGYDSAGVCVQERGRLKVYKKRGRVSELEKELTGRRFSGAVGIAHTRWATHGEPNEINAHPHLSQNGRIAIVHNGIIENHGELRELLISEGYKLVSKTDSEVLAHLIERHYEGDLNEAVIRALRLVRGTFALAVIDNRERRIIAARRGSPIIIGIGENEMFVASDVPAILNYTKRVLYLYDDEVASISQSEYSIRTLDWELVGRNIHEISWTVDQMEKKGFKHFMLKEIFEQPEAITNTLRGRIVGESVKLDFDLDITACRKIVITACGTSWHSALIGKYLIEGMNRLPVEVDYASEYRYRDPIIGEGDLLIVISQSGETADTLASLREAKSRGAKVLGIVNVLGSTIAREVDYPFYLHAGPEIGVASTKAFTCQIAALVLISLHIKQERGEPLNSDFLSELLAIPEKIDRTLKSLGEVERIAAKFKDSTNFLYLGRGINFPIALEGALKLKEISYIHAEGYPAAEMKHGPIALIDERMPVAFIATQSRIYEKVLNNMQEVKARKGEIITVVNRKSEAVEKLSNHMIIVPETREELSPLINVIPLQLLAYHIADKKNINVDKPRNLAKSVTVE